MFNLSLPSENEETGETTAEEEDRPHTGWIRGARLRCVNGWNTSNKGFLALLCCTPFVGFDKLPGSGDSSMISSIAISVADHFTASFSIRTSVWKSAKLIDSLMCLIGSSFQVIPWIDNLPLLTECLGRVSSSCRIVQGALCGKRPNGLCQFNALRK